MISMSAAERGSKGAGRKYLEMWSEWANEPQRQLAQRMLEGEAHGCPECGSAVANLAVEMAIAVPAGIDIEAEVLIQWQHELEQEVAAGQRLSNPR